MMLTPWPSPLNRASDVQGSSDHFQLNNYPEGHHPKLNRGACATMTEAKAADHTVDKIRTAIVEEIAARGLIRAFRCVDVPALTGEIVRKTVPSVLRRLRDSRILCPFDRSIQEAKQQRLNRLGSGRVGVYPA